MNVLSLLDTTHLAGMGKRFEIRLMRCVGLEYAQLSNFHLKKNSTLAT